MRYLRGLWSILAVITLFAAPSLLAQQFSAVSGTVSDPSGGVIGDVKVSLDNSLTGFHAETTTNDVGSYRFVRINPADGYEITFSKNGFQKFVFSNITLGASTTETYNVTLQVGSVSTSVEVKAAGEITLNTSDASVGNVIDTKSISELPIQARLSPASLLTLQAGVNDAGSITGARSDQGNITLDGLDVNDQATGQAFTSTIPVSIDSLQEIRTVTAGETADYGRSSGGGINLVTRSGTNNWHGNASEYNRNTLFEANDWFNNRSNVPRAPLIRNQFGGQPWRPHQERQTLFLLRL